MEIELRPVSGIEDHQARETEARSEGCGQNRSQTKDGQRHDSGLMDQMRNFVCSFFSRPRSKSS